MTNESGAQYEFKGTASIPAADWKGKGGGVPNRIRGSLQGLNSSWCIPFQGFVEAA